MALKGDFDVVQDEIGFFFTNGQTGERGAVVGANTIGTGQALDDPQASCHYVANPSSVVPLGVCMHDVVNKDVSQTFLNPYKRETLTGSKVWIMRKGHVLTNRVEGTPSAGGKAYLGHSGFFATSELSAWGPGQIGRFLSNLDSDGYAKVSVDIN